MKTSDHYGKNENIFYIETEKLRRNWTLIAYELNSSSFFLRTFKNQYLVLDKIRKYIRHQIVGIILLLMTD